MVEITEEVVRLIMKEGYVVLVSTVDEKGVPNVSPRFVLDIIGKKELLFADAFRDKTFSNVRKWPKVSVAVLDRKSLSGFQLKGQAEKVTSKRLVDHAGARLKEHGLNEEPLRVWAFSVEEVSPFKPRGVTKFSPASPYA